MQTVLHVATLLVCAMGVGRASLAALRFRSQRETETAALSIAAGLGLIAVLFGVLGLFESFSLAQVLVPVGAVATVAWYARQSRRIGRLGWRVSPGWFLVVAMLIAALLGAIAPVTESDSLSYPLPIAQRIAHDGAWHFWPDLARSVYPPSYHFLTASLIGVATGHVGLLSGVALAVTAILIAMLAKRVAVDPSTAWVAVILALGSPAVAFLAGSAKEDLFLLMMTAAGALALYMPASMGSAAMAGLFAGLAAGAKYTGAPIGLAIVACVPLCCGRARPSRSLVLAAIAAVAAGGLWYCVSLVRFGNPIAPFLPSIGWFPGDASVSAYLVTSFGSGREPLDAVLAPFRMTYDILSYRPGDFGGRLNWVNPLAWIAVPYVLADGGRRRLYWPLLVVALALYIVWFAGIQVSRLLLPASVVLSVPAAQGLVALCRRYATGRYLSAIALTVSAGIVIAVGGLRFGRYALDPAGFLARETDHYPAIQWMNTHLDPARHRVVTDLSHSGYLRIPWMNFAAHFQVEIPPEDLGDPVRLRAALKARGFTHVFGVAGDLAGLDSWLTPVYTDPASRAGSARFFRSSPTDVVGVFTLR